MTFQSGEQVGEYRIIEAIGSGGMGQVFLSEHVMLREKCALKVLPTELAQDPNFRDRFQDEARLMYRLRHPHIVRVHNLGQDRGVYFLVMDFITGSQGRSHSLQDELAAIANGQLPEDRTKTLALQIAEALGFAHEQGVVHRDLKPANVLIDENGNAHITDFGLAKAVGEDFIKSQIHNSLNTIGWDRTVVEPGSGARSDSSTASILGTYDYMSPEQRGELAGVEVGPSADVYALGILLYRVLTGKRPSRKAATHWRPDIDQAWDDIIDGCLEDHPRDRFASALAVKQAIEAIGSGAPETQIPELQVTPPPPPIARRPVQTEREPEKPKNDEVRLDRIADVYTRDVSASIPRLIDYLKDYPRDDLAWTILGHAYEKVDQFNDSQSAYESALAINPQQFQAITGMGVLHRQRGNYDAAMAAYWKALEIDPNYAQAYSSMTTIALKRHQDVQALEYAWKGYELDKTDPVIAANLAVACHYNNEFRNRKKYTKIAKKLGYHNMAALKDIYSGAITVRD